MNQEEYFMTELAEFFKHCLNVAYDRPNNIAPQKWMGWCRCRIEPYLVNGRPIDTDVHPDLITHKIFVNDFTTNLLYTIEDYFDYFNCFNSSYKYSIVLNRTKALLQYIQQNKDNIKTMIHKYKHFFPKKTEVYTNNNIIDEHWNDNNDNNDNNDDDNDN